MSGRGFDFLLATLLHLLLHKSAIFSHVVRYKNSLGTRIRGFLQLFEIWFGARYWFRTSDPCRVKAVLYP